MNKAGLEIEYAHRRAQNEAHRRACKYHSDTALLLAALRMTDDEAREWAQISSMTDDEYEAMLLTRNAERYYGDFPGYGPAPRAAGHFDALANGDEN